VPDVVARSDENLAVALVEGEDPHPPQVVARADAPGALDAPEHLLGEDRVGMAHRGGALVDLA